MPSTRTCTICARSSAPQGSGSKRCAALAIGWQPHDGELATGNAAAGPRAIGGPLRTARGGDGPFAHLRRGTPATNAVAPRRLERSSDLRGAGRSRFGPVLLGGAVAGFNEPGDSPEPGRHDRALHHGASGSALRPDALRAAARWPGVGHLWV